MAHKAIREFDANRILAELLPKHSEVTVHPEKRLLQIASGTDLQQCEISAPWILKERLVAKVDQLVKRRMKNNLVLLDVTWAEVRTWISDKMGREVTIDGVTGELNTFLVEPFVPHEQGSEYYVAIRSVRTGDEILFSRHGGVSVGDVDHKAKRLVVGTFDDIDRLELNKDLLDGVSTQEQSALGRFIRALYKSYVEGGFAFLEINPAAYVNGEMVPLDIAARLDDREMLEKGRVWGFKQFPPAFGRHSTPEEEYIAALDENSGASLKLTILNPQGRLWTLLAGGGASVVFTDTIGDLGFGSELANYGEYSGDPSDEETYNYARTVLEAMTAEEDPLGREKILIIGGGIANFTDVAKTFRGIAKALTEYQSGLHKVKARIFIRRGGPNYQEGLARMKDLGHELEIPFQVYGPEMHMTRIVKIAMENAAAV